MRAAILGRLLLVAALLASWALPMARLAETPEARALVLAADAVCRAEADRSGRNVTPIRAALVTGAFDAQLKETAALFLSLTTRQWTGELLRVLFAAAAAVALALGSRIGLPLALLAAALCWASGEIRTDAYRLFAVAPSPGVWWAAVANWSAAMRFERLVVPAMAGISLVVPAALLLFALLQAGRRAGTPRSVFHVSLSKGTP